MRWPQALFIEHTATGPAGAGPLVPFHVMPSSHQCTGHQCACAAPEGPAGGVPAAGGPVAPLPGDSPKDSGSPGRPASTTCARRFSPEYLPVARAHALHALHARCAHLLFCLLGRHGHWACCFTACPFVTGCSPASCNVSVTSCFSSFFLKRDEKNAAARTCPFVSQCRDGTVRARGAVPSVRARASPLRGCCRGCR